MRRPPSTLPSAPDRASPEPRTTSPAGGRVQRTVTRSVRCRPYGCGCGLSTARPARQPAEYRLRDEETAAQRQEVRVYHLYIIITYKTIINWIMLFSKQRYFSPSIFELLNIFRV